MIQHPKEVCPGDQNRDEVSDLWSGPSPCPNHLQILGCRGGEAPALADTESRSVSAFPMMWAQPAFLGSMVGLHHN